MSWFNLAPEGLNLKEKISPFFKGTFPIAPTSYEVIGQVSGMKLLHFTRPTAAVPAAVKTPLLIIPSMINRYYVLDLLPGKSFIEYQLSQGVDIYLLDWGTPYDEDNWMTLEQLITHRLDYFVDLMTNHAKTDKINILGHCLGGTLATLYALLFETRVNGLMLLTAPIDFEHGGKLGHWVKQEHFRPENVTKAYGQMPWWVLQTSFQMLKPMLPWYKFDKFMKEMNNPEFIKNFLALEVWSQDNVSFPGRCFLTLINELYKKNALVKGEIRLCGQTLSLQQLQGPVLNIAASDDHIVLFNSTLQNYHVSKAVDFESITSLGGHIGAILGSRSQKNVWPQITNWLTRIDSTKH